MGTQICIKQAMVCDMYRLRSGHNYAVIYLAKCVKRQALLYQMTSCSIFVKCYVCIRNLKKKIGDAGIVDAR